MAFDHDFEKFPELTNTQLEVMGFSSPFPQITEDFEATVVKVHDADTITLRVDFRDFDFPLRLLDIDAPELSEGDKEAGDWVRDRLLGEEVLIQINKNNRVGKYGRLLGRVFHSGMDLADEMLNLGLVEEFGKKNEGAIEPLSKIMKEGEIG